jgi:sec-independent protein translocase protein TatA
MAGLGTPELIIVALVFVLLFGARKLPELGSSIGKSIKNFKRGIEDANADDETAEADGTAVKSDDDSVSSSS